jgi:hypothetical protein
MAYAEQNMQRSQLVREAYGYHGQAVDKEATLRELLGALTGVSFLPVNSVSQTVIIMGKLASNPAISIFLKIFDGLLPNFREGIDRPPYETLNLRAEYQIYSELYKLRQLGLTPNVLARVGTYRIVPTRKSPGFLEEPALKAIKNYQEYFYTGLKRTEPRLQVLPEIKGWQTTMCIMSCSVEFSLYDCLAEFEGDMAPTRDDIVCMLYQIMHVLTWFERIQMSHHDLHTGNIRVEYHAEPIDLYYQHKQGECVYVSTKYVIKMYDFDRSTIYKQTDLGGGGGMVVQSVYNYDTGFGVFNAKEDAFKLLRGVLSDWPELLYQLIPGLDSTLRIANIPMGTLYANLPRNEVPLYEAIMNNNKCSEGAFKEHKEFFMTSTFTNYVDKIKQYDFICLPPGDDFSLCSIYIPNSLMLAHLDILDVLSSAAGSRSIDILSAEGAELQTGGQPIYATPNIYYNEAPPSASASSSSSAAPKMGRKRVSENNANDEGYGSLLSKRQRTSVSSAKPKSSWLSWLIPTILPGWWWQREKNRSNPLERQINMDEGGNGGNGGNGDDNFHFIL